MMKNKRMWLTAMALAAALVCSACGEDEAVAPGNSGAAESGKTEAGSGAEAGKDTESGKDAEAGKDAESGKDAEAEKEAGEAPAENGGAADEKSEALAGYDESISSDIFFRQVERVADDVILVWRNRADESVDGVQLLRAEAGSSQYEVVAVLGKESTTNDWRDSYIDLGAGAGGKTYQYVVRNVSGDRYGKASEPRTAKDTEYRWYKGEDGYICCRPWSDNCADFTEFSVDFQVMWNCDWQYFEEGDNTYELTMMWEDYNGRELVRVTADSFCFMNDDGSVRVSYSAVNDVPLSIGQ